MWDIKFPITTLPNTLNILHILTFIVLRSLRFVPIWTPPLTRLSDRSSSRRNPRSHALDPFFIIWPEFFMTPLLMGLDDLHKEQHVGPLLLRISVPKMYRCSPLVGGEN